MRRTFLSAALLLLAASPLFAQHAKSSSAAGGGGDGLWFSGGLGGGWARVACDQCITDRGNDISGNLAVGGRLNRRWLIGAEASGWKHGDANADESLWGLSAVAYVQPVGARGLMWKTGVGLLNYRISDAQDQFTSTALGFQLGLGYIVPVKGRISVQPYLNAFLAPIGGEVKFNSATIVNHASLSLLQFGIGVMRR